MNIPQFPTALFTAMSVQTEYSDSQVTKAVVDIDRFCTTRLRYKVAQKPGDKKPVILFKSRIKRKGRYNFTHS
jgi:hypothetical protein